MVKTSKGTDRKERKSGGECTKREDEVMEFQKNQDGTLLTVTPDSPPKKIPETVRKEVDNFSGDVPQFDDITMIGLYYYGPGNKKGKK